MKKTAKELIVEKLRKKVEADLTFGDLDDALLGMNQSRKNQLLTAVRNRHKEHVGRLVLAAVDTFLARVAEDEADTALADGVLTTAELEEIFDDS